jgi:translation initiation factor 1 (eIF-1/SUI1)
MNKDSMQSLEIQDSSADVSKEDSKQQPEKLDKLEKEALKKAKKLSASKVTLKRLERNKRKHVVIVSGLHIFSKFALSNSIPVFNWKDLPNRYVWMQMLI